MRSQKECIELLRGYFQNMFLFYFQLVLYFQNKAKDYGIVRMALFGSVVRNEQTEESDVDIAYEGEANLLLRSRMKQELESLFGCRVDIIRLRKQLVDSVFGQNVENDLIYV